jgi:hypothetical protein
MLQTFLLKIKTNLKDVSKIKEKCCMLKESCWGFFKYDKMSSA